MIPSPIRLFAKESPMAFSAVVQWDENPPDDFSKLAVEVSITGIDPTEEIDVALPRHRPDSHSR